MKGNFEVGYLVLRIGGTNIDKTTLQRLKASLLECGFDKIVNQATNQSFRTGERAPITALENDYGVELVKVGRNINKARYKRKKRLQEKVGNLIENPCVGDIFFLTLTFRDEVLANTTAKTRREYVRKFLKRYCVEYAANIDFGGQNGREHYHALAYGKVDEKVWAEKCGFIKSEKVRRNHASNERLCKYTAKLTNHALKVNGGKAPRIIYSRRLDWATLQAIQALF